jgi:hypothetical protein
MVGGETDRLTPTINGGLLARGRTRNLPHLRVALEVGGTPSN